MKGTLSAILLVLVAAGSAAAQQQPQFSHYGFNGMYLNPAYAGIKGQGDVTLIGRYQYAGYGASFDTGGSPKTVVISGSVPLAAIGGGLGFHIFQDEIAVLKTTNLQLSYSKHIKVGAGKLGLGVQGVMNRFGEGSHRALDPNDPKVPVPSSDTKFDIGGGAWYESDKLYAGLSVNNLLRSEYTFKSESIGTPSTARILAENHAYFTAGYNIEASSALIVTPTVIAKLVLPGKFGDSNKISLKNNSYEVGARATLNDKFWGGVGYRYDESFTGMLGMSFAKDNALRFGYALDLIAFNQAARAPSSHEIMLSYRLPKPGLAIRPAIRTPRYSF
ncbi:type IX secretion system membrane protein PorP/SprF [Hymenobacter fastidiosus]|uniref:Type IX secretion system membrane protein PorP/SprF n=1 Tax=Hymenobacter fastidiosus TaxID=486264 RepID=A0ABP7RUV4_9BACT